MRINKDMLIGRGKGAEAILNAFGLGGNVISLGFDLKVDEPAVLTVSYYVDADKIAGLVTEFKKYNLVEINDIESEDKNMNGENEDKNMSINEQEIEQEIQDKGLNAPRLTPESINAVVVGADYYVFPGTTTTVCRLALANGYSVVGTSACVSLDNFDEEIGKKVAYEHARNQIWQLEGYLLAHKLSEQ